MAGRFRDLLPQCDPRQPDNDDRHGVVDEKLLDRHEDRLFFAGVIVIAANAGGAWSPIGDVTTTMLWIGGQITTMAIIKGVFLASLTCLIVP